jgi:hypothetical protein
VLDGTCTFRCKTQTGRRSRPRRLVGPCPAAPQIVRAFNLRSASLSTFGCDFLLTM